MANSLSLRRIAWAALLAVPSLVAACGARGPLDIVVIQEEPDAVGLDAAEPVDAGGGEPEASPQEDSGRPGFDAGGLVNCGTCLYQNCGTQLFACLSSTACRATLQCAVTKCLSGGTPDPQCVFGCANGDQASLGQLVSVFGCVVMSCGSQCTSLLGGLGGGGLGGGGGGSGGGGTGGGSGG